MSDSITFTPVTPEQSDIIYALIGELRQDHALDSLVVREGYSPTHFRFTKPVGYE